MRFCVARLARSSVVIISVSHRDIVLVLLFLFS